MGIKICPKCGRENNEDEFYCTRCGTSLPLSEKDIKRAKGAKHWSQFAEGVIIWLFAAGIPVYLLQEKIFDRFQSIDPGVLVGIILAGILGPIIIAFFWYLTRE